MERAARSLVQLVPVPASAKTVLSLDDGSTLTRILAEVEDESIVVAVQAPQDESAAIEEPNEHGKEEEEEEMSKVSHNLAVAVDVGLKD
jgi:hypothetical protein